MENLKETIINASHELPAKGSSARSVIFSPDLQNNIHSLKLKNKGIHDFVLASILMRVPSLKALELYNVQLIPSEKSDVNSFDQNYSPREMTSFIFAFSDFEILNFLSPLSIAHIRLTSSNLQQCPSLTSFLQQSKSLTKLELQAINCDLMDFFKLPECPFQLRYLSLVSTKISNEMEQTNAEALAFLRHHTTLNFLEIRAQLPLEVLRFAMKKFRMLKSLTLRLSLLPIDEEFYAQKSPRKSVKNLTLEGPFIDLNQIKAIFKLYSGVQALSLDNFFVDFSPDLIASVLELASTHLTNISELTISRIPFVPAHVTFKFLSILRIKYINSLEDITSFTKNAKNLRAIHVDFVFRHQLKQEHIDELLRCNLTKLCLTSEPYEIYKLYKMIEESPENSKLISVDMRAHAFNYFKCYNFRFKKTKGGGDVNYQEVAEKMRLDMKDYLVKELMDTLEEGADEKDDDCVIIDYVMDSFVND